MPDLTLNRQQVEYLRLKNEHLLDRLFNMNPEVHQDGTIKAYVSVLLADEINNAINAGMVNYPPLDAGIEARRNADSMHPYLANAIDEVVNNKVWRTAAIGNNREDFLKVVADHIAHTVASQVDPTNDNDCEWFDDFIKTSKSVSGRLYHFGNAYIRYASGCAYTIITGR